MKEETKKKITQVVIAAVVIAVIFYVLSLLGAKKPEQKEDEKVEEKPEDKSAKKEHKKEAIEAPENVKYNFIEKWDEEDQNLTPNEDTEEEAVLSIGDYSSEVAEMQRRMILLGSSVNITGKFDNFTANELKQKLGINPERNNVLGSFPSS